MGEVDARTCPAFCRSRSRFGRARPGRHGCRRRHSGWPRRRDAPSAAGRRRPHDGARPIGRWAVAPAGTGFVPPDLALTDAHPDHGRAGPGAPRRFDGRRGRGGRRAHGLRGRRVGDAARPVDVRRRAGREGPRRTPRREQGRHRPHAVPCRRRRARCSSDPGEPGTHAITSSDYRLAPVKLPGISRLSEMVGHIVAPVDATDASPLVLFLHGRHEPCYTPGEADPPATSRRRQGRQGLVLPVGTGAGPELPRLRLRAAPARRSGLRHGVDLGRRHQRARLPGRRRRGRGARRPHPRPPACLGRVRRQRDPPGRPVERGPGRTQPRRRRRQPGLARPAGRRGLPRRPVRS